MDPQKKVSWKDLWIGVLALSSFIIVALSIILMGGGEMQLFQDYVRYRTFFPEANGLKAGSEVWLAGVEVGQVETVKFADPGDIEAVETIEVVLAVEADISGRIRQDSFASLRTIGLLGDKYVEIKPGTPDSPVVRPDGIIDGISLSTFDELVGVGRTTARGFNELMEELRQLAADINNQEGTLGKVIHDQEIYRNINATLLQTHEFIQTAQSGSGTLGKMMSDPALYNNLMASTTSAQRTLAELDSTIRETQELIDKLQAPESTFGKLTGDTALYEQMQTTLNRMDALVQKIERGEGTLGKLTQNENLTQEMEGVMMDLRALIDDVKRNPSKYIKVSVF